jgi:hypothetical protein
MINGNSNVTHFKNLGIILQIKSAFKNEDVKGRLHNAVNHRPRKAPVAQLYALEAA